MYRDVLERSKLPRLARSLFCSALVNEAAGELEGSGWRFLEAAWACDDKNARAQARICRERAAEMFDRALSLGEAEPPAAVVQTLIAELWRRAGRFDDALAACDAADAELADGAFDDDDERSGAAAVTAFVRRSQRRATTAGGTAPRRSPATSSVAAWSSPASTGQRKGGSPSCSATAVWLAPSSSTR